MALRDATLADAEFLYALRTDPDVVVNSNRIAPPDLAEHTAWLERALANKWVRLFIIEAYGGPAGQCRLDVSYDVVTAEVSIALIRSARGQGLGTRALRDLAAEAAASHIRWLEAVIKETNIASRKAFLNAGYSVEEIKDGLVHMGLKCGL
jgi:RimJ/RimL family protein N-acetyltransferase